MPIAKAASLGLVTASKKNSRIGVVEIVVASALMGLSGPFIRLAALPASAMTFIRAIIPALVLGLWIGIRRWKDRPTENRGRFHWLALASVLNAIRTLLYFEAYNRTSLGNAVLMLYTWPVFTLLFARLLLAEPLRWRDGILMAMAFLGMAVVFSGSPFSLDDQDFVGMSLMILSASLYSLSVVLIRREGIDRLTATFWQNIAGVLIFFPAFLRVVPQVEAVNIAWGATNALVVGTLAFTLFFSSLGRISAAVVGHLSYLEVVFALFWAVVAFGETLDWRIGLGGSLIVLSMMVRAEWARRDRLREKIGEP